MLVVGVFSFFLLLTIRRYVRSDHPKGISLFDILEAGHGNINFRSENILLLYRVYCVYSTPTYI